MKITNLMFRFSADTVVCVICVRAKLFKSMRFWETGNCQREKIKISIYNFSLPFQQVFQNVKGSQKRCQNIISCYENVAAASSLHIKCNTRYIVCLWLFGAIAIRERNINIFLCVDLFREHQLKGKFCFVFVAHLTNLVKYLNKQCLCWNLNFDSVLV